MSGGVDSSVAAALLLEKGYKVIGITMKTYDYLEVGGVPPNESNCCDINAALDARAVADKLGFPHYVLNLREEFGNIVINNFIEEYLSGRTPNPCIICNKEIKWGALLNKAESLGASYLATGHYARVQYNEQAKRYDMFRPRDVSKDQTYVLWGLSQYALSKTLFPNGELLKTEVREIAAKYGLKTAAKEESYELCFVVDNNYRRFLIERLPFLSEQLAGGDIVFDGRVVGKHQGFPYYTIGQRSGLGAYGERMYVTDIDAKANTVKIGRLNDLFHKELIAKDVNLIAFDSLNGEIRVQAQVRYKDTPSYATVFPYGNDCIRVVFDEPKRAITPGQSVVMYDGNRLIGGGVIERIVI